MEKTFREVIATIKEGEVWENEVLKIKLLNTGYIDIENKLGWEQGFGISIQGELKFKLKRKEYTFQEAFVAYEEGKEIESCLFYRYEKRNGADGYYTAIGEWSEINGLDFSLSEIRGKWYINE